MIEVQGNHSEVPEAFLTGAERRGQSIRNKRELLGLSQEQVCTRSGCSQGYYSQIELGKVKNLGLKTSVGLARAFGIELNVFVPEIETKIRLLEFESGEILESVSKETDPYKKEIISSNIDNLVPSLDEDDPVNSLRYTNLESVQNMNAGSSIGLTIKDLRNKRGISQGELSRASEISQGYLSQLENGEVKSPSLRTLNRISSALNCDIQEVFGVQQIRYPYAIEKLDRFLKSENADPELKKAITAQIYLLVKFVCKNSVDDMVRFATVLLEVARLKKQSSPSGQLSWEENPSPQP